MMSLANEPFPGPSSTSCNCPGRPAPIHSLTIHTPISWNQVETRPTVRPGERHLVLQYSLLVSGTLCKGLVWVSTDSKTPC